MTIDEVEEEVIENTDTPEEEVIEETEAPEEETEADTESEEEDVEERIVTIGDPEEEEETSEEEHKEAPEWVKTTRKVNRRLERENKRLKKQLEAASKPPEETVDLGPEPTLESSGFDDKKYKKDLIDWHERSRKVEEQKLEQQKVLEEQQKAWQNKQTRYADLKKEHNFKDFKDAEEIVSDSFNQTQQGIIVQGADDPALLVYALGKYPKKLEELSKITDPVDFAFKVAKLEAQLKVTNKKAPAPEKRISGGKTGSGSVDKTLDRLRSDAERTGDYSKVREYKLKLRGAN